MLNVPSIFGNDININEFKTINKELWEKVKNEKNNIDHVKNWDIAKKYTNEYEFIFSFNNEGVADISPISRSYFKLIEIINDINLFNNIKSIKAAFLCEAPGGFIQAFMDYCQTNNIEIKRIDTISLLSQDKKIPQWKITENNKINIHNGIDGTGNLYNIENIKSFVSSIGISKCDLVTADGGFDFSYNFNSQEKDFQKLLLHEIYTCLLLQNINGTFIIKVFDLFDDLTIQIISLLRYFYGEIIFHKPKTSRPCNSEKYIICLNFKVNEEFISLIEKSLTNLNLLNEIIDQRIFNDTYMHITNFNLYTSYNQIYYIKKTLEFANSLNMEYNYMDTCREWCTKYNIKQK